MRGARLRVSTVSLGLLALVLTTISAEPGSSQSQSKDPLAAEIERWAAYLRTNTSTDEDWVQLKQAGEPALESARDALRDGRRLMALHRLGQARMTLSAARYVAERPASQLKDAAAFDAEWARVGGVLGDDLRAPSATALDGVRPAAVRAIGEAALPQVKAYYDTSLDFAHNTMAKYGLLYMGLAQAQREFAAFCRALSAPTPRAAPPLRSLSPELDRLEGELLAAYRPPAAIDRHDQFIAANSTLKEARELDALGLRYGALVRYLQAVVRTAPLLPPGKPLDAATLGIRLQELDQRLSAGDRDDSIGRLFLEIAQADVKAAEGGKSADVATAIVNEAMPRYFAALGPARPEAPRPAPEVTVTLVRWPYT